MLVSTLYHASLAHAGMISPVSRNSIDRTLPAFRGGKSPQTPCTCANGLEKEFPGLLSVVVLTESSSSCWTDAGMNYNSHAHNIRTVENVTNVTACCATCTAVEGCEYFTFVPSHARCYLKNATEGREPLSFAISGGTGAKPPFPPAPPAGDGSCKAGALRDVGGAGQPCLWWSQGCSIGCATCATNLTHGKVPPGPIHGNPPHADKAGFRKSYCANPTTTSTLPREAWTMNVHAVEGSVTDSYRFNPWRAPGYAPVVDACGQAGGKYMDTAMGGDSAFTNTTYASFGDLGSVVLPKGPSAATWAAGSSVQVSWGIRYNHGGGYSYRLCPADDPRGLSEACFQDTPLDFDRTKQTLVWNNGTRFSMGDKAIFVTTGTFPAGSMWARNPIPRVADDMIGLANASSCPGPSGTSGPGCIQFPAPCPGGGARLPWSTDGSGQGECSGDWTLGVIEDTVLIPAGLAAGDYVLGWRWDCEETAQVWQNCADVTITA